MEEHLWIWQLIKVILGEECFRLLFCIVHHFSSWFCSLSVKDITSV